jgi:hypothetical protein
MEGRWPAGTTVSTRNYGGSARTGRAARNDRTENPSKQEVCVAEVQRGLLWTASRRQEACGERERPRRPGRTDVIAGPQLGTPVVGPCPGLWGRVRWKWRARSTGAGRGRDGNLDGACRDGELRLGLLHHPQRRRGATTTRRGPLRATAPLVLACPPAFARRRRVRQRKRRRDRSQGGRQQAKLSSASYHRSTA